jgi:hypothetical protein
MEKKFEKILTDLARTVGACANSGDIESYQFLLNHVGLIFEAGFVSFFSL